MPSMKFESKILNIEVALIKSLLVVFPFFIIWLWIPQSFYLIEHFKMLLMCWLVNLVHLLLFLIWRFAVIIWSFCNYSCIRSGSFFLRNLSYKCLGSCGWWCHISLYKLLFRLKPRKLSSNWRSSHKMLTNLLLWVAKSCFSLSISCKWRRQKLIIASKSKSLPKCLYFTLNYITLVWCILFEIFQLCILWVFRRLDNFIKKLILIELKSFIVELVNIVYLVDWWLCRVCRIFIDCWSKNFWIIDV